MRRLKNEPPPNKTDKILVTVVVLIFAVVCYLYIPHQSLTRKGTIFHHLHMTVSEAPKAYHRVAVGYNSCLDLIVRGQDALRALKIDPPSGSSPLGGVMHDRIQSEVELWETFLYSFEHGIAVERFIESEELCAQVMHAAQSLDHKTYYPGGNAALMASRFANEGSTVLLGGAVGLHTRPLLPKKIQVANEEGKDEIHLIMEFSRGEKWGPLTAPRDNRLIVHCDYTNSRIGVLEGFHLTLMKFNTDLLVLSGLHLLEREDPSFRTNTIASILSHMSSLGHHIPIHLELASIADLNFVAEIGKTVLPHTNSLGLNEQELGSLYFALGGDINDNEAYNHIKKQYKDPTVESITKALIYIFEHVHKFYKYSSHPRQFGRIHLHSLKYHIVAQKSGTGWESGNASVAAGALAASIQSCDFKSEVENVDEQFMLPFDDLGRILPQDYPVQNWTEDGIQFYLAPVLVCKTPKKTVGLGDAISAMGLLYHKFKH